VDLSCAVPLHLHEATDHLLCDGATQPASVRGVALHGDPSCDLFYHIAKNGTLTDLSATVLEQRRAGSSVEVCSKEQRFNLDEGKIVNYQVNLAITFVLGDAANTTSS
jgi:hypothetical protein